MERRRLKQERAGMVGDAGRGYPSGSITKIELHNFMTYEDVVIHPGPNLNMIIGSNGTGKSSILCAILLALGGHPRNLGRSTNFGAYVKKKCDEGFVRLHLRDMTNIGNVIVQLRIMAHNGSTQYFIDGNIVSIAEVQKLTAEYNIQDKVKSFSAQNPQQLLENTEKAASAELHATHERLKKQGTQGQQMQNEGKTLEDRLRTLNNEIELLTPRVNAYQERTKMNARISLLKKRLAFIRYQTCFDERIPKMTERDALNEQLKKAEMEVKSARKQIEKLKEESRIFVDAIRQAREDKEAVQLNWDRSQTELDKMDRELADASNDLEVVRKKAAQYNEDLNKNRETVEGLKMELTRNDRGLIEAQWEEASQEYRHVQLREDTFKQDEENLQMLDREIREMRRQQERFVNEMEQTMRDRVNVLQRESRLGAFQAWEYYQRNRGLFSHPVDVVMLAMEVNDDSSAKWLENIISNRDMEMFVFGSKEDEARLTDRRHPWHINSTVITEQTGQVVQTAVIPDDLKRVGFKCFANQLFKAPVPVVNYLCKVFQLHRIPIGTEMVDQAMDAALDVVRRHNYGLFLTATKRVQVIVSRYSNEISIKNDHLRNNMRWLRPTRSTSTSHGRDRDNLEQRINEALRKFKNDEAKLKADRISFNVDLDRAREKKTQCQQARNTLHTLERAYQKQCENLRSLEANRPDIEAAEQAHAERRRRDTIRSVKCIKRMVQFLKKMDDLSDKNLTTSMALDVVQQKILDREMAFAGLQESFQIKQGNLQACERQLQLLSSRLQTLFDKVKELTGLSDVDRDRMEKMEQRRFDQLWAEFKEQKLPAEEEEMDQMLAQEEGIRAVTNTDGGPADVAKHTDLLKQREETRQEQDTQNRQAIVWRKKMDEKLKDWVVAVEKLVASINLNFAQSFASLGCTGEVRLKKPDNDRLIASEYGIEVFVKFRPEEKLQRLDHQVQSGGERSVSTMIYLMALQELSPVPFRCVDEINQGMDANNERRVFDMMVEMLSGGASNLSKTQYFLLTPKLLPGLKYSDKVTVLVVHNGPGLVAMNEGWRTMDFIAKQRRRRELVESQENNRPSA